MYKFRNALGLIFIGALFSLLSACGGSGGRFAYSNFIVFGASLSDTGNVYAATAGASPGASPSYYSGRWSNSPLWIDSVASSYGKNVSPELLGGTNYAYGGAMTCTISTVASSVPDMCLQVNKFLSYVGNKPDSNALYVIDASAVGNEITKVLGGTVSPEQVTTVAPNNVVNMLQLLYSSGARRFLVVNAPDVGTTPLVKGYGANAVATATSLSTGFNSALSVALGKFIDANSQALVYRADINGVFSNMKSSPSNYGLNNVNDACLNGGVICSTPDTYLFWDSFHPTKTVGNAISSYVLGLI